LSQSLPNQVNDFNDINHIPNVRLAGAVAIPSKPGQRLQYRAMKSSIKGPEMSQSLPNQVNDFNDGGELRTPMTANKSQSLPNQVNDFNFI